MNAIRRWALPWLLAVLPLGALAQSAHWDPPGGPLAVGETAMVQLVFDDCEPKGTPTPPRVAGLGMSFAGQSNNISMINGSYSHTTSYNFAVLLSRRQGVDIPAFEVETDKGRLTVAAVHFDPTAATVGGGQPLESAAHATLQTSPTQVWTGQVFNLAYTIEASRSYYPDFGRGVFDWNPAPLVAEDWSRPEPFDLRAGAEPETGLIYRTRALAHKPGSYRLNAASQVVNLSVGVAAFGFFQQRQYQQFSVTSDTPTIDVRPLPPAPAGFSGAVGSFKLASKVVPEKAAVGEPVTWTLELSGEGNWPDIAGLPAREVSDDFQVVAPKAKKTPAENKLFDSKLSEDIVLMPTKAGRYVLRPVTFIAFDPKSGTYQTLSTPPTEIVISPPAGAAGPAASASAAAAANPAAPAESPAAPTGLPRDPLPESGLASFPLDGAVLAAGLIAAPVLLLLLWLLLAVGRARETDPARPRREARLRLAATLERLGASGAPLAPGLLAWQRDAALLWGVVRAAPTAETMPNPAWAALWSEADRAIFAADQALPADWTARAKAALAGKPAPRFAWLRTLHPRSLFPFLSIGLALAPAPAYRQGNFSAAESGWRREIAAQPADWAARYNLSLALSQQDRWDEAAAHATAAFVQQPSSEPVRWQYELACSKAGFAPGPLAEFLSSGPRSWLASYASPGGWERLMIAAAWAAAAAGAVLLARGYGRFRRRGIAVGALAALGAAVLLFLAAWFGRSSYGAACDRQAVLVWRNTTLRSIPTEADAAQKTVPLGAGSLATADRSFLGWLRLDFDNGQTGWIRKEEVVWLWK